MEDNKITVVFHKKTKKLIPFIIDDITGEVIITLTEDYVPDDLIVSRVDPRRLDFLNGYIFPEGELNVEK